MNIQKPLKQKTIYDKDVAGRVRIFREKFIDKTMSTAAKLLGIHQPTLSRIEAAEASFTYNVMQKFIEQYHLNEEWLRTGYGDMQKKTKPETGGLMGKSLSELKKANEDLQARMLLLERTIKIMEANQTHFINRIESFIKQQEPK